MKLLRALTATAGAMALWVAPANAALDCGDEVDQDRKLKSDLSCGLNEAGLVVTADGVDLDLNGHTISGNGDLGTDGVLVDDQERVTVHGGTIKDFEHGISAVAANRLTVEDMKIRNSGDQAVRLNQVTNSAIRHNELLENQASSNVLVTGGLSEKVAVTRNRMTMGGITFDGGPNHKAIRNRITDAQSDAITLGVTGNVAVRGNTIEGGEGFGVLVEGAVEESAIESNRIAGTDSSGIFFEDGVVSTTVDDNTVTGTSNNGISISNLVTGIKIRGNRANGNANHGIGVEGGDVLIRNNVANSNEGYGILSGSSNGSGNRAKNNDGPAQCSPASLCE
jgi:nitrous oxidase accessory protein NosD